MVFIQERNMASLCSCDNKFFRSLYTLADVPISYPIFVYTNKSYIEKLASMEINIPKFFYGQRLSWYPYTVVFYTSIINAHMISFRDLQGCYKLAFLS